MGKEESSRKMQVSQMLSPCPASRPCTFGNGEKAGRERAEPWGQLLVVPLGHPFPQPPCRNSKHASLPSLTASGPPAAGSHRSEPAQAGTPRDVTRGAVKGRGPCPATAAGIRMRSAHAGGRLAPNQCGSIPRKNPVKGQKGKKELGGG